MGKRLQKTQKKKMKRFYFAMLLCALPVNALCQETRTYTYDNSTYGATMSLMENGEFIFTGHWEVGEWKVCGNWQIRNDSILVLNSLPKKTRFMVREEHISRKHKRNHAKFRVLDDSLSISPYILNTISIRGDTIRTFVDSGDCTVKNDFESFYIVRYNGKSPTYKRKNKRNNDYLVLFPGGYIFENERWKYNNDYLTPLDQDGICADYKLTRVNDVVHSSHYSQEAE